MENICYTEEGKKSLRARLSTALRFYNDEENNPVKFPINHRVVGFPDWNVESREELYGRIKELAELTCSTIVKETVSEDQTKKVRLIIEDGN